MEKRRFKSLQVFSCLKKVNPRILLTFKRSFSKKMGKTPSSHSEPIRLLKSQRSLIVYILNKSKMFRTKDLRFLLRRQAHFPKQPAQGKNGSSL